MKKTMLLTIAAVFFTSLLFAQTATIKFNIRNFPAGVCQLFYQSGTFAGEAKTTAVRLNETGHAVCSLELTKSRLASFSCYDSKSGKALNYMLFISPGDQLSFDADILSKEGQITVAGKGSNNNQPLPANLIHSNSQNYYGDTIPNRVIANILKEEALLKASLEQYISQNNPSADFVKVQKSNLDYWAINAYYSFKENNRFQVQEAYKRNFDQWQSIQDSLLKAQPLDNPQALYAPTYTAFIASFLLRQKENLWTQQGENKAAFYAEWYGGDEVKGAQEFEADMSNALCEKIINKYFTGKTAEYLYVHLITGAVAESNPKNLLNIYSNFEKKYNNSEYKALLTPMVDQVRKRQQQKLNERMVFADSTATKFNTFADLLNLAKDKTVLVDMWGTWCSPCRQEIEAHSAAIKKHFKDKDLQYFYVANYDTRNTKSWKELIGYLNLEGTHVLANQKLTDDIMTTIKASGYPTYFIIKKDGSFELSKGGYPMNRDKLFKQLDEAMTANK